MQLGRFFSLRFLGMLVGRSIWGGGGDQGEKARTKARSRLQRHQRRAAG